jgi:hypothetical protein
VSKEETLSNSICEGEIRLAERELAAFIAAVTMSFGTEQAELSAEDWLDEARLVDTPPRPMSRDWRAVTIMALARLAGRLNPAKGRQIYSPASADTKASPIPLSNCSCSAVLL